MWYDLDPWYGGDMADATHIALVRGDFERLPKYSAHRFAFDSDYGLQVGDDGTMFSIEGITKRYGGRAAVRICARGRKGEFFRLFGPNGAGKTTTIKSLIGLVRPDEGRVLVGGTDPAVDPIGVRKQVGFAPTHRLSMAN
jgi:ABC-type glutathione transport system ATPase component